MGQGSPCLLGGQRKAWAIVRRFEDIVVVGGELLVDID